MYLLTLVCFSLNVQFSLFGDMSTENDKRWYVVLLKAVSYIVTLLLGALGGSVA